MEETRLFFGKKSASVTEWKNARTIADTTGVMAAKLPVAFPRVLCQFVAPLQHAGT